MFRAIGEMFCDDGVWVIPKESNICGSCYYNQGTALKTACVKNIDVVGGCSPYDREDDTGVLFERVE